jgi:hypothetical protein
MTYPFQELGFRFERHTKWRREAVAPSPSKGGLPG